jgi:hypothetical protein
MNTPRLALLWSLDHSLLLHHGERRSSPTTRKGGDTIDSLLSAASASPISPGRPYGSAPMVYPAPESMAPSYGGK